MSSTSFTDSRENNMGLSPYLEYSSIGITTCVPPDWIGMCISTAERRIHLSPHFDPFNCVFKSLVFGENGLNDPVDTIRIDAVWSDGTVQALSDYPEPYGEHLNDKLRLYTEEDRVCAVFALHNTSGSTPNSNAIAKAKATVYYDDSDYPTTSKSNEYQKDTDVEVPLLPGEMLICSAGNVLIRANHSIEEKCDPVPLYLRYYGRRQGGRTLRKTEKVWQSQFYTIGGEVRSRWDDEEDDWRSYYREFHARKACDDEMRLDEEREKAKEIDVKSYGLHNFMMIRKNRKKNQRGRRPRYIKRNTMNVQGENRTHFRAEVDVCTRNGTFDDLVWIKQNKRGGNTHQSWWSY